jgi:hypothetical protein
MRHDDESLLLSIEAATASFERWLDAAETRCNDANERVS